MAFFNPQSYARQGGLSEGYTALVSPWAAYVDIDPAQWRRLYDWLLAERRVNKDLYILHDAGQLLTVNPVYARVKLNIPDRIENPVELARTLYKHWKQGTIVILERNQYQAWLTAIQSEGWTPGDDLLAYGLKMKDFALQYEQDGIVLYPSPLSAWRDVKAQFLKRLGTTLAPGDKSCTVFLAVYYEAAIWTSLVLQMRAGEVHLVTTFPAEILAMQAGSWRDDCARLVSIAENLVGGPVAQGISCERHTFEGLGISPPYWQAWVAASERGEVLSFPRPLGASKQGF